MLKIDYSQVAAMDITCDVKYQWRLKDYIGILRTPHYLYWRMTLKQTTKHEPRPTDKHPSGLTWERWHQPFKMPEERKMIQQWLQKKQGNEFDQDPNNPF